MDCLFCKIVTGEVPAKIIYQDELIVGFDDIFPQAPVHKVFIPKQHIATLNDLTDDDQALIGRLMLTAIQTAKQLDLAQNGYRIVNNCNADGGQTVFHIHLHLLGGRRMHWPPG